MISGRRSLGSSRQLNSSATLSNHTDLANRLARGFQFRGHTFGEGGPTFAEGVTAKLEAAGETVRKIGVVRKGRTGVELTA